VTGDNCSWLLTYTFSVTDNCGNVLPSQTITYSGGNQNLPSGTPPSGQNGINSNYIDGSTIPAGVPSFDATAAASGYTDNCGESVTATLTGTAIIGDNCSWSVIYTFSVTDGCNTLSGQTITHSGSNQVAPTGTPPLGITGINACYVDEDTKPAGVPDFDATEAASGYLDNNGDAVTAVLTGTAITGGNCSWSVVYTFSITDGCNTLQGEQITHTGSNQNQPVGTAPLGGTGINSCMTDAEDAVPAFATLNAAAGYNGSCGEDVTVSLTGTSVTGDNCSWLLTYTFSVTDNCGNVLPSQTVTYSGGTEDLPTGTAPSGDTGINSCMADAEDAVPAFATLNAAAGYNGSCGEDVTASLTGTSVTGDNCSWLLTYTFSVTDNCGNVLPSQTITYSGGTKDLPTGTAPSGDTGINACMADAEDAVPAFATLNAAAGYNG
jgi:hypothetical protein